MEVGFMMDKRHRLQSDPQKWVEGDPEPAFFFSTRTHGKRQYVVESYRCVGCGFLESYAREE